MKKISLSIFVALLAVSMAVPASAAKLTVDGKYTNKWTYVDGNIEPSNLFDNQELALNLTLTEGEMFKAYLPLKFTTKMNQKENTRGIQIGMTNKWYISFVSDEASVWASQNKADGYKFAKVGDPMGIGNNVNLSIGSLISNGFLANPILKKVDGVDNTLNILLKGQFKLGPVNYTTYVSDNTLLVYNYKLKDDGSGDYELDENGKKKKIPVVDGDYVTSINRLTVDLPYDITVGATASYLTKSYVFNNQTPIPPTASATNLTGEGYVKTNDKFSQLTLSADASYKLPIEKIGGKLTVAAAGMFQREGLPKAADEPTKMKYVKDSLGFFVGATDFKVGPVTLGLDFSLTQPKAFSLTATYPSVPNTWSSNWSLGTGENKINDRFYYITDSTSRYIPNTMILNANAASNFNVGKVGIELNLNNKLNMALSDINNYKENKEANFSTIVNNITNLKATLAVSDDITVKAGTILDYRFAEPYTGKKLEANGKSTAYPVVDGTVGAEFSALALNIDARVRYYGKETEPVEGVVWGKFTRDLALTDTISVTPTVAGAFGIQNKDKEDSEDRITGIGGLAFVGVDSEFGKFSVDGAYLLNAQKKGAEGSEATVNHVANVTAGVKLSEIFTASAGYTFRTDISKTNKAQRHFVNAKLTAQVSDNTKLVLTYGQTGLGDTDDIAYGSFDQSKAWSSLIVKPGSSVNTMHWDKVGLSLSIGF